MAAERVLSTDTVPLQVFVRLRGSDDPAPGETDVGLRAYSEALGQFLDWADLTFKAAGHTTLTLILTDTPFATNAPGLYERSGGLDLTAVTNLAANDSLTFLAVETVGSDLDLPAPGMLKIDQWVEDIRTPVVANLDATVSSRSTFDQTTDPVELLETGGSAGINVEELIDLNWDELNTGAEHNIKNSTGKQLRQASGGGFDTEDVVSATAGTITLAATESSIDDFLLLRNIAIVDGLGVGQIRIITAYNGTTKVATLSRNWDTTPDATSDYLILLSAGSILEADTLNVARDAILNDGTRFAGADVGEILTDTGTTIPARLTGIEGAGFLTGTDSLEAIRDRGDAAWTTATGFAVPGDAMDLVTDAVDADALATSGLQEMADHLETDGTNPHGTGAWDATAIVPPQTIRDAMKLTPTAGAPAAGSIDKHLDDINALADLDVAFDNDTQLITIQSSLERERVPVAGPTAIAITWRDTDGTVLFTLDQSDATASQDPDAQGTFHFTLTQALANDVVYYVDVTITDAIGPVSKRHFVMTAKGT